MAWRMARLGWSGAGLVAALAVAVGACNVQISDRTQAKDQWQRHYTLAAGGTLEIRNTNGLIHVEPADGNAVDITADRVVSAGTDQAAKAALAAFTIRETVSPDRIAIDSSNQTAGILINMSRRVDYHVRVPAWANLSLTTTNGDMELTGAHFTGTFHAESTNGHVQAAGLEGAVTARTTNGPISLDVSKLAADGLSATTTNGTITITVPKGAGAHVSARVTNGSITPENLGTVSIEEQSRRLFEASIDGGGPTIHLQTTNGAIRVKGK